MKITLNQLRRIIKEELNASQEGNYQFVGDVHLLDEDDKEEISKILKGKKVDPGEVQVKGGSGGAIKLVASNGRTFDLNIQNLQDDPEGGNKSPQQKTGGKPQQNGQK